MAQYKVLQDIEAEDKLLGPLSLRQFIYAILVLVFGFVGFRLAVIRWYLAFPFLPPMVFFGLLAAPFGRDQPSEVWLLAKIRFFLGSRRRIWDQSGMKELVTITAPKKIEKILTKGFSQQEVKSRLSALSATLDTRGWAVKNVDVTTFQRPIFNASSSGSDRLVDISTIPQNGIAVDESDDILDARNNPHASKINKSLVQSDQQRRQALLQKVRTIADAQNQTMAAGPALSAGQVISPSSETTSQTINTANVIPTLAQLEQYSQPNYTAVRNDLAPAPGTEDRDVVEEDEKQVAQMLGQTPADPQTVAADDPQSISISHTGNNAQTAVTPTPDPAILKLVKNENVGAELSQDQAALRKKDDSSDGEVVISLR